MDLDPRALVGAGLGALTTAALGIIGMIRRIDAKVGRTEFHEALERRDTRVLEAIAKQNETSAEYRALTTELIRKMSEDIAVLKDRQGRRREPRT